MSLTDKLIQARKENQLFEELTPAQVKVEKTLIDKKTAIQKLAAKITNDNLVPQLSLLKKAVDEALAFADKNLD